MTPTVLVTRRILEGRVRPGFVYREEPDTGTDSGWRALVGDETPEEADDPMSIRPEPLDEFVQRWPEVRPLVEADAPGEWRWDGAARAYVPLTRDA